VSSANPNHTYTSGGNFNVLFIVSDPASCNGADTVIIPIHVNQTSPVNATFDLTVSQACDPPWASVNFTGSGGTNFYWNFGDGFTTIGWSQSHSYANAGTYVIQLIVVDTVCPNADTATM